MGREKPFRFCHPLTDAGKITKSVRIGIPIYKTRVYFYQKRGLEMRGEDKNAAANVRHLFSIAGEKAAGEQAKVIQRNIPLSGS
ncbi:hypothetical protein [Dryocola sp. BD613]|uniref:hypothetical protein n=1 Tax=Dryocola sp. BD613 TaxID=3133272 RepID=UPI003F504349